MNNTSLPNFIQQTRRNPPPGLGSPTNQDLCYNALLQMKQQRVPMPNPPFPQPTCVTIQRRDSVKSEGSQQVELSRYKTEMCRPFEETGQCRYGSKCQFAHGSQELRSLNRHPRYKTQYCRTFHTTGFCTYGQRCNFIHNEEERRSAAPTTSAPRPQALYVNKPISSTGVSPAGSVNGDASPTHSPSYLNDDVFSIRLSPTPSFGSSSSLSSFPSPPGTPQYEDSYDNLLSSPLDMGLSFSLLSKLSL